MALCLDHMIIVAGHYTWQADQQINVLDALLGSRYRIIEAVFPQRELKAVVSQGGFFCSHLSLPLLTPVNTLPLPQIPPPTGRVRKLTHQHFCSVLKNTSYRVLLSFFVKKAEAAESYKTILVLIIHKIIKWNLIYLIFHTVTGTGKWRQYALRFLTQVRRLWKCVLLTLQCTRFTLEDKVDFIIVYNMNLACSDA